ncbi:MAG: hypothetical protein LBH39_01760 [Clostridiales Family XIII bacterium]|nr:hypothetical protein [Clostridiales Family XIII bacterium]
MPKTVGSSKSCRGRDFMKITNLAPKVSSYDFMRYLCASLAKNKNVIIDPNSIVDKVFNFKKTSKSEFSYLFDDIEFRASIDSVVSYDINEGINNLQTFGIIGKLNPTYEKIVIYLTDQDAESILTACDETTRNAILELANTF